jgi:hypothetical protein
LKGVYLVQQGMMNNSAKPSQVRRAEEWDKEGKDKEAARSGREEERKRAILSTRQGECG